VPIARIVLLGDPQMEGDTRLIREGLLGTNTYGNILFKILQDLQLFI
jgi:hypothetical protein